MLLLRLFTDVENEEKARDLLEDILSPIKQFILLMEGISIEPYWKIEEEFVVECHLQLDETFGDIEKETFLNSIAESSEYFGDPGDEYLISDQYPGYIKKGVKMLNLFFNW